MVNKVMSMPPAIKKPFRGEDAEKYFFDSVQALNHEDCIDHHQRL